MRAEWPTGALGVFRDYHASKLRATRGQRTGVLKLVTNAGAYGLPSFQDGPRQGHG
jgi:hypothetical protein